MSCGGCNTGETEENANFYQSYSLSLIRMSYYFLCILGYYIKLSTEIGPNSNVTESTVRKIKQLTQKF